MLSPFRWTSSLWWGQLWYGAATMALDQTAVMRLVGQSWEKWWGFPTSAQGLTSAQVLTLAFSPSYAVAMSVQDYTLPWSQCDPSFIAGPWTCLIPMDLLTNLGSWLRLATVLPDLCDHWRVFCCLLNYLYCWKSCVNPLNHSRNNISMLVWAKAKTCPFFFTGKCVISSDMSWRQLKMLVDDPLLTLLTVSVNLAQILYNISS